MKTARKWPWKSVSSKECVTTHGPNLFVSKMDNAKPKNLYKTNKEIFKFIALFCRKHVLENSKIFSNVNLIWFSNSTDLDGSSKYKN